MRAQDNRAGFSGSVSIPSITKNRAEPGRSMSASSGLGMRKYTRVAAVIRIRFPCVSFPTHFFLVLFIRDFLSERQRSEEGAVEQQLQLETPDHDITFRELAVVRRGDGCGRSATLSV